MCLGSNPILTINEVQPRAKNRNPLSTRSHAVQAVLACACCQLARRFVVAVGECSNCIHFIACDAGGSVAASECKGTTLLGLPWASTASGALTSRGCGDETNGVVLRRCCGFEALDEMANDGIICSPAIFGQWMAPDYSQCYSPNFGNHVDELLKTARFEQQQLEDLAAIAVGLYQRVGSSNAAELLQALDHMSNGLLATQPSDAILTSSVHELIAIVSTVLSSVFSPSGLEPAALAQLARFPSTLQQLLQQHQAPLHVITNSILVSSNEFNSSPTGDVNSAACTFNLQWPSLELERQLKTASYTTRTRLTAASPCTSTPVANTALGVTVYHNASLLRDATMAVTEAAALTGLPDAGVSHVVLDMFTPPTVLAAIQDHCQRVHEVAAHEASFSLDDSARQLVVDVTTYTASANTSTHRFNATLYCQSYSVDTQRWNPDACSVIGFDASTVTCECRGSGVVAGFLKLEDTAAEFELTVGREVAVMLGAMACLGLAALTALLLFVRCRDQYTLPQLAFANIAVALLWYTILLLPRLTAAFTPVCLVQRSIDVHLHRRHQHGKRLWLRGKLLCHQTPNLVPICLCSVLYFGFAIVSPGCA